VLLLLVLGLVLAAGVEGGGVAVAAHGLPFAVGSLQDEA